MTKWVGREVVLAGAAEQRRAQAAALARTLADELGHRWRARRPAGGGDTGRRAGRRPGRLRAAGGEPIVVPLVEVVAELAEVAALAATWIRRSSTGWWSASPTPPTPTPRCIEALPGRWPRPAPRRPRSSPRPAFPPIWCPPGRVPPDWWRSSPAGAGRVLVVQARDAEPVLADGLAGKGWRVTVVRPYASVPLVPSARRAGSGGGRRCRPVRQRVGGAGLGGGVRCGRATGSGGHRPPDRRRGNQRRSQGLVNRGRSFPCGSRRGP